MGKSPFKFKPINHDDSGKAITWQVIYGGVWITTVRCHPEYPKRFTLAKWDGVFMTKAEAAQWYIDNLETVVHRRWA